MGDQIEEDEIGIGWGGRRAMPTGIWEDTRRKETAWEASA